MTEQKRSKEMTIMRQEVFLWFCTQEQYVGVKSVLAQIDTVCSNPYPGNSCSTGVEVMVLVSLGKLMNQKMSQIPA